MPDRDLVALWEAHCRYEFETRDVDATMATMVAEPYVNHVPTMTGGVGHDQLKRFYKYHFIGGNPPDTAMVPVSRTVGADQIVDEVLSASPIPARSTGCCRVSSRLADGSRSRLSPS
jgi:carboxymethylenebutenolidase